MLINMNLEEAKQMIAKLEILLKLQNAANEQSNLDVKLFINKFVEENK